MYLLENPVLQRELLVNLRMKKAFLLQFLYVLLLGGIVWILWPHEADRQIDFTSDVTARRLFNIFFVGQFVLVTLMSPSFAAGSISGEKERKTYEMLLASPLQPTALLLGKLLSSMCYLTLLIVSSIPLLVLCYPLGGVGLREILAAYLVLMLAAGTFGLVSIACSSYFHHTAASLAVSYLAILPMALVGLLLWWALLQQPEQVQLNLVLFLLLPGSLALWAIIGVVVRRRLLHPPDVGSEGKEVIDEDQEQRNTVGLVIQRDQFPDKLFAPAKREDLLDDGANPVLDKELRSEIFAQGTLMMRVVIQVSMLLAIPLMAWFLFFKPEMVAYYVSYVVVFNMLVGPVFSAPLVTAERERHTLDLLLTTVLRPGKVLWAKLVSGLRISTVLTFFLVWPMLLAYCFVGDLQQNFLSLLWFMLIIAWTCLATTTLSLLCSVLFRKTAAALVFSYLVVLVLFGGPVAAKPLLQVAQVSETEIAQGSISSPVSAAFAVPLTVNQGFESRPIGGAFPVHRYFLALYPPFCLLLFVFMMLVFRHRCRAA